MFRFEYNHIFGREMRELDLLNIDTNHLLIGTLGKSDQI